MQKHRRRHLPGTFSIAELRGAVKRVSLVTGVLLIAAYLLMIGVLLLIGFEDAMLHFVLATVFTIILAPTALFPLFVMSDRLQRLLRIDDLTSLPNRRAFFEKADDVFKGDLPVTLMMIDVDHFKAVNDRHGHAAGDLVLRSVAESIRRVVDGAPGVGERFAARLGGEEFAVLLEDQRYHAHDSLAAQLIEAVENIRLRGDARGITVTVSIGVASRTRLGETADEVLRSADKACYRAKRLGRNQWRPADLRVVETVPANNPELAQLAL